MLITKYKFNNTLYNLFPEFNSEFGFTYTDEVNGNITTRTIESDSSPTMIRFGRLWVEGESTTDNRTDSLLEVLDMNVNSTDCSSAFRHCRNVTSINLSNFNTSSATRMDSMFNGCSSLTSLDLSGFDTSAVYDMNNMFLGCSSLTSLNLSGFNIMNSEMSYIFQNCTNLISVIIHNLNSSSINKIIGFLPTRVGSSYGTISISYDVDSLSGITTNASSKNWNIMINKKIAIYTFNSSTDTLPIFNDGFTYTYTDVNNGDGTITRTIVSDSLPSSISFGNKKGLVSLSHLDTSNVTDMSYMFQYCTNLTSLDVSSFNTSNATNMYGMFEECTNLTVLDLSSFDTSNVINMGYMFKGCTNLTTIDLSSFNTSNVITMYSMFRNCNKLTTLDLSSFITSSVTDMSSMFYNCNKLTTLDLSSFNTSRVTNMYNMFYCCNSLTALDLSQWNTGKVRTTESMFQLCTNLTTIGDLSGWKTSELTNMKNMFKDCSSLTTVGNIDGWRVYYVENMEGVFDGCTNLTTEGAGNFRYWNPERTTTTKYMFRNCKKLTNIDISFWDPFKLQDASYMFDGCESVEDFTEYGYSLSDWGESAQEMTNLEGMFRNCKSFTTLNIYDFNLSQVTSTAFMFAGCESLYSITTSNCDMSGIETMESMFEGCINLERVNNIQYWNVDNLKSVRKMFYNCKKLHSIEFDDWNINLISNLSEMFANAEMITEIDVTGLVNSNAVNINSMFYNCKALTSLVGLGTWNVSNVTSLNSVFRACNTLGTLDLRTWNVSNVTDYTRTFDSCTSLAYLNVSNWNTNKATTLFYTFAECHELSQLIGIEDFDTSNVTNMCRTFDCCFKIPYLDVSKWDVSKVQTMYCMFFGNTSLKTLVGLENWIVTTCTDMTSMFCQCSVLSEESLRSIENWDMSTTQKLTCMLYDCKLLTEIDLSNWQLTNLYFSNTATNSSSGPRGMFDGCINLEKVTLNETWGDWDIYDFFFHNCFKLKEINGMENWKMNRATCISRMFLGCHSLESLDLSKWQTSNNLQTTEAMFYDCINLTDLNISNFNFTHANINIEFMFEQCPNLKRLVLNNCDFTNINDIETLGIFEACDNLKTVSMRQNSATSINNIITALPSFNQVAPTTEVSSQSTEQFIGKLFIGNTDKSTLNEAEANSKSWKLINSMIKYTFDKSIDANLLPVFNTEYIPDITDVDNSDGTITRSITSDVLPTQINFYDKKGLISVESLETGDLTTMKKMFCGCDNLISVDLSNFDTGTITDMSFLFDCCYKLEEIKHISSLDTRNVIDMKYMFCCCCALKELDVSSFDTSKLENLQNIFDCCESLTSINVTNLVGLTVSETGAEAVFNLCSGLTEIIGLNTWKVERITSFHGLFSDCSSLVTISIDGWNMLNLQSLRFAFDGASSLEVLDMSNCTIKDREDMDLNYTFRNCTALREIVMKNFIGQDFVNRLIMNLFTKQGDQGILNLMESPNIDRIKFAEAKDKNWRVYFRSIKNDFNEKLNDCNIIKRTTGVKVTKH